MLTAVSNSFAGIWAPVVGVVAAAFITTVGGVIIGRAQRAAKDSRESADRATEGANSISAEKQLIKTLETAIGDMRQRLVAVEIREERCQQRLAHLERRDEESFETLRDASILQRSLQHEVEDLREQLAVMNEIVERRKLKREH